MATRHLLLPRFFAAAMMRPHEVQFTDILRRNTLEVNVKVTMAVLMVSLNRVYTLYIFLFKIRTQFYSYVSF
jgi:hypothetical protein